MTSSPQLFSSNSPFTSLSFISLADGSRVPAIGKETLPLSSDLILMDVLLVPSFPMSLLWLNLAQIILVKWCSHLPAVLFRTQGGRGRLGTASLMADVPLVHRTSRFLKDCNYFIIQCLWLACSSRLSQPQETQTISSIFEASLSTSG